MRLSGPASNPCTCYPCPAPKMSIIDTQGFGGVC